jgi:hypothetical protein
MWMAELSVLGVAGLAYWRRWPVGQGSNLWKRVEVLKKY